MHCHARHLFGVRAQVIRSKLSKSDASSYARGLLIGAEIADALPRYFQEETDEPIPLVGNEYLCRLYAIALDSYSIKSVIRPAPEVSARGFLALHASIHSV